MLFMHYVPLALSIGELAEYATHFIAAGLICFVLIAAVASYLRFEFMMQPPDEGDGEVDATELFQMQVLRRMGTGTRAPDPFCLLFIRFRPEEMPDPDLEALALAIRTVVRSTDLVHPTPEGYLALVVDVSRTAHGAVIERLRSTLEQKGAPRTAQQIAGVCYPETSGRFHELVDTAHQAWKDLGTEGGVRMVPEGVDAEAEEELSDAEKALLDDLTGILKPDHLVSALQKFVARMRKDAKPVSLLYLDVDYLERYNRHYGREGGDAILRQLGKIIETRFRETDLVGRYDGEEFLIAAPGRAADGLKAAQRIVAAIKKQNFLFGSTKLKITASIGVAGFPEHGTVAKELFDSASAALLAAKSRGRGNAMAYEEGMPVPDELDQSSEML